MKFVICAGKYAFPMKVLGRGIFMKEKLKEKKKETITMLDMDELKAL